jgi:hypothetical protein
VRSSPTASVRAPEEAQRCVLDISTEPLTFLDWAGGAAVTGVQHVLGAA